MLSRAIRQFLAPPVRTVTVAGPSPELVLLALWLLRARMPQVIAGERDDCSSSTARDMLVILPGMIREAREAIDARDLGERTADDEAKGWLR